MSRPERSGKGPWWDAAAVAEQQHGVVSRGQLRAIGMGEGAIDYAVSTGRLFPLFRGTFAVGHLNVGTHGRMFAAVLACGRGAVVSHGSAAFLLGLWESEPRGIHVIASKQAGRKIPGIRRHHVPPPVGGELEVRDSIPCTSPARTVVDLAGGVGIASLRRTVEQAAVLQVLDVPEIEAILSGPRRRGSRNLRGILDDWRSYSGQRLRSGMEAKLLALLARRGLPTPSCNEVLEIDGHAFEIDFLWRQYRLAVETDGSQFHDNPFAEARDLERDRVLARAGIRLLRLRWEDLRDRPEATIAKIERLLNSASGVRYPPARKEEHSGTGGLARDVRSQ